uniref:Uncharacterized protein n=1 Tax=Arion vulgaris TaxID=1028688 RepID=A0A0B7B9J0_9EUPU
MLNKSTKLHNKSSNTETDHKMNPAVKFATSEENGGAEKIIHNISDDEESEIVKCYSNISSLYDDSEFSSSSNEDREDVVNRLLEHNFGFHTVAGLVKGKMNTTRHSSPNLLLESNQNNRVHVCLGLTTSGTLIQDSDKMQITKNQMDTHKNTNLVFLKRCRRIVGLDTISNYNSSNRNLGAVRSRQRIDNTNSLVNSAAQTNHRALRNDRHRSEDVNNNAAGYRHLTSYLKRAPLNFKIASKTRVCYL